MRGSRTKQVKTFHLLDVAKSIETQNQKVAALILAINSFLSGHHDLPGADILRKAVDDAIAAMWPDDERE